MTTSCRISAILAAFACAASACEFTDCFDKAPTIIAIPFASPGAPAGSFALIDTGATYIAVDTACKALLDGHGTIETVNTSSGVMTSNVQRTLAFSVDGLDIPAGQPGIAIDTKRLTEALGFPVAAVLGYPILKDHVVDIDPDHATVRILDAFPKVEDLSQYATWPFELELDAPWVRVVVGNVPLKLMIDTGNNGFLDVSNEDFAILERNYTLAREKIAGKATSVTDTFSFPTGTCEDLPVDRFTFASCRLCGGRSPSIGMDFIRNFRFIIDYPHGVIRLKPGKHYPLYQAALLTGLHLHYLHGKTYAQVDEGTVAYDCGLRDGFKIVAIGQHPVSELGYYRAAELLRTYVVEPVAVDVVDLEDRERRIMLHE